MFAIPVWRRYCFGRTKAYPETMMFDVRSFCACSLVWLAAAGSFWPALASGQGFPFDRELMLDVAPMRGSKRVPILEIAQDGAASLDLWCSSLRGKATVGEDSITIVPEAAPVTQCAAERQSGDAELLAALAKITNWRRRGDVIELIGTATLRFRLMTN